MMWLLWPLLTLLDGDSPDKDQPDQDADSPDDDQDDDDQDERYKEIRDPKALIKSLRDANRRLVKKLEKREARIKELEAADRQDENGIRSARLETAFMRAVFEYRDSIDLEAAWDLANLKGFLDGVRVEDDGSVDVEALEDALGKLVERYPYLITDGGEGSASEDGEERTLPKTRHPRPTKTAKHGADRAALEKRFPALRTRRRPF